MTTPALAPEVRERPIIFSAPMVRAILAGRKTQTRRVLRWQPDPVEGYHSGPHQNADGVWGQMIWEPGSVEQFCPLRLPAAVGDCLWVRETWCHTGTGVWSVGDTYTALDGKVIFRADDDGRDPGIKWFSPLYLPRNRSRLTLEVTEVRVERLQDISEADAVAEGICPCNGMWSVAPDDIMASAPTARWAYQKLWCGLHGPASYEANPWVAAITFRRLDTPPADTGEAGR